MRRIAPRRFTAVSVRDSPESLRASRKQLCRSLLNFLALFFFHLSELESAHISFVVPIALDKGGGRVIETLIWFLFTVKNVGLLFVGTLFICYAFVMFILQSTNRPNNMRNLWDPLPCQQDFLVILILADFWLLKMHCYLYAKIIRKNRSKTVDQR